MDPSMVLIGLLVVLVLVSGIQTVQLVSLSNFIQTGAMYGASAAQTTQSAVQSSSRMVGGC